MERKYLQPDPDKMRTARINAGITLTEMSQHLGVLGTQVVNIESGYSEPKGYQLLIWAQVCGVTCESLATMAAAGDFYFRKKCKPRRISLDNFNAVEVQ